MKKILKHFFVLFICTYIYSVDEELILSDSKLLDWEYKFVIVKVITKKKVNKFFMPQMYKIEIKDFKSIRYKKYSSQLREEG